MARRSLAQVLRLAAKPSARPDPKEVAGHGGGLISDALYGSVSSRISTYNPDRVGLATYEKMLTEPTLKACHLLNRFALKAVPVDVEGKDPDVVEFVRGALMPVWGHVIDSCAYGIAYGCSPNELVWERGSVEMADERVIDGWLVSKVKDIKPSSLRDILVTGLEEFAGYTLSSPQGRVLDAEKAFHYVHDMAYGNVWGTARLKAAYDPWYSRQVLQMLYLRFMERRVVPPVHVTYPDGYAADEATANASIAETIATGFQSDSTAIWTPSSDPTEPGWDVSVLETQTVAQIAGSFLAGLRHFDLKMMTAMLTPEKVLIGDAGAYALSETHKDVWLMGVEGTLAEIVEAVNDQIVPRIVRYTFGDVEMPRVVAAGMSNESRTMLGDVLKATLASAGSVIDIEAVCERLDVPTVPEVDRDDPEPEPEPAPEMADVRRAAALLRDEVQSARLRLASHV